MITMLITTCERGPLLAKSLRRLTELTPPDEIVVVDDGSHTRAVHGVVETFQHQLPLRYIYNNNPGLTNPCLARNIGLQTARGDEILVTEPEIMFMTDVVAQLRDARGKYPDAVLYEPFCWHEPRQDCQLDDCNKVPGFYCHLVKREWLFAVGGWDERMPGPWGHDDIDLWGRLDRVGHGRRSVPGVEIRHQWHESRIEPAVANETYCKAKEFPRDVIANIGLDWGKCL